jgi:PAS domain S-box-containing protein
MQPITLVIILAIALAAALVALAIRTRTTASFEEVIEAAPDAMLAVRSDGTIRAANRRVTAIFGYEPAELVGRPIELLVPERRRPGHPELRQKFMAEGVTRRMGERSSDLRGLRKDGTEVPVDISLSVVKVGGRRLVFAAVRDLTPNLKAQADEQERLRQILDTSPVGVAITVEGIVRFANPSFTGLLGVRPGDAMAQIYKNPEERQAVLDRLEADGIVRNYEVSVVDTRGAARTILLTLIRTEYEGKDAKFGWAVDVTHLKKTEAAMRRINFLSDSALDLTKAGYWYVDLDDVGYYEASDRVRDIFGEAPKPDRRYHLADEWHSRIAAVDAEAAQRVTDLFEGAIDGRYDQYDAEYPYRRPADGRVIWTRARAFVERDESGKARKMFGVQQDLTHQREAEQLRDSLTHMIVHDLRSPLNGILLSLELLGRSAGVQDPKAQAIIQRSIIGTQTLTHMINTLLDLNKMEAGEMTLNRSTGDLHDAVAASLETLSGLVGNRDVVFERANGPVTVSFDRDVIVRVVSNLLANALKFTPKDGRVTLRVGERRGGACVEVIDTGPGIPPEHHARIFEKFGQVEGRQKQLGTGLGLAFCKLALEAHGGTIGVESVVGQGSTFWFVLP